MRVILLEDIQGVGRKNEVKDVPLGYARNFLLPKNLAEAATPQALKKLVEIKTQTEEEKKKLLVALEERKKKMEGMVLEFKVKAGEKGEVFGSVSARDIETALEEKGILDAKAELKKPLKELGDHQVKISLGEGIRTEVKVLLEKD